MLEAFAVSDSSDLESSYLSSALRKFLEERWRLSIDLADTCCPLLTPSVAPGKRFVSGSYSSWLELDCGLLVDDRRKIRDIRLPDCRPLSLSWLKELVMRIRATVGLSSSSLLSEDDVMTNLGELGPFDTSAMAAGRMG